MALDDMSSWESEVSWVAALERVQPQALILPLELPVPGRSRQDLYGLDLLSWLRWSAPDATRGVPVLALAWQPVIDLLRKRPEWLLINPAIEFCTLPEGISRIAGFVREVIQKEITSCAIQDIEIAALRQGSLASTVSHHELANDYYAAYRLWQGYLALLRLAQTKNKGAAREAAKAELGRLSSIRHEWEPPLLQKLRSPLIRQFQASRSASQVPRYPTVSTALEVISHHLNVGLPSDARILFVDDEFDKGMAEVLLEILFHARAFTRRTTDEWVYSEESTKTANTRWARFVCVRSAPLALNWLAHWSEIPGKCVASAELWRQWLKRWREELTGSPKSGTESLDSHDLLGENRSFVLDSRRAAPRTPHTVMLLDLRLEPVVQSLYSVRDFSSVELRTTVKSHAPEMPVIMFTASRQLMNAAELLDSTRDIDGWLVKEGPDIPVDPESENSASAVAYLLERVHLYSTLAIWYREQLGWDSKRKLACAQLYNSPHAHRLLEEISNVSGEMLEEMRKGNVVCPPGDTFLAFIQSRVPSHPFPATQTLVARRLVIAALLLTADVQDKGLEWNAVAFDGFLPGRAIHDLVIAVYDKINFNQVLWMRSADLLSQLLTEEFDWLENLQWPDDRRDVVLAKLHRERTLSGF